VTSTDDLNLRELERYLDRIGERFRLDRAVLGGARVADAHGAPLQRERGPEYVVVLVSETFGGVPWLERVYQAANLWDSSEMGSDADVHCYTPAELERKVLALRRVRDAVIDGIDLLRSTA
jgi:hypothetical protein